MIFSGCLVLDRPTSLLISWSLIWLYLIVFIIMGKWQTLLNSHKRNLGLTRLATSLEFTWTYRHLVRINHWSFWKQTFTSLKYHQSRSLCEGVRLWMGSLVTQKVISSDLIYFYLWLGRRYYTCYNSIYPLLYVLSHLRAPKIGPKIFSQIYYYLYIFE